MLKQDRLKELLSYDQETGIFTWNKNTRNTKVGQEAGHKWKSKRLTYIQIGIDSKVIYAHRLAWMYVHGNFPGKQIDHINGNGCDNRISNLREVEPIDNGRNQQLRKNNTSGHIGVTWNKEKNKWCAQIHPNGIHKTLGYFDRIEEAISARKMADIEYEFHANHGRINSL